MNKKGKTRLYRQSRRLSARNLIIVSTEGAVTEKTYIDAIRLCFQREIERRTGKKATVCLKVVVLRNQSSPKNRLRALKREIDDTRIDDNFTAWLICDRDEWTPKQFEEIRKWVEKDPDRNHWILSSPNFEYWLKLHFKGADEAKFFFARYDKRLSSSAFTYDQIMQACQSARDAYSHRSSLFEQDGSEMFKFVEFLASRFGL